ncbi:alkaline phosphatase family protein [Streptococcus sp. NLN64]|uniref:LTA synthase family protein n=1 Tax=Streptococcus sp. NLN64 TaxID=2822799 RepID=UPI0018C8D9A5|nr:alkaline phosphatase family protein [Streptococcus sp. NLN64]MBG9366683.1 sulfatase-like hydrolase/transferase [Streptococcus sp. NLN64]
MNKILESLSCYWLECKNLVVAKSTIFLEDSRELISDFPVNIRDHIRDYLEEKYDSAIDWVDNLDWSARVFEFCYSLLMFALTILLLSNYFLGQFPNFLGLTTEGIMWIYLFIVLFAGILTLPFAKLKTIFPILIGYILYFPLLFLLEWSRQLNNPDFKLEQLYEVHPLTQVHFYSVAIVLVIAFLLNLLKKEFLFFKQFETTGLYRTRRSVWTKASMAPLMVTNPLFLEFVSGKVAEFAENNQLDLYLGYITGQTLIWFSIGFILFASLYNSLREIGLHHFGIANAIFSSFVFAVVFNLLFQAGVVLGSDLLGKFIFPQATMFQITTIFFTCLLIYSIINRFLYSTLLITLTGIVFAIANAIKFSFRQEPLIPTDFIWIKQPELFVSFVDINLFISLLVIILMLFYIAWNIQILMPSKRIFSSIYSRLGIVIIFLGLFQGTMTAFRSEVKGKIKSDIPIISLLNNWYDVTWMGLSTNASYKSLAYVWARQLTQQVMETPEQYSKEKIEEILSKYEQLAEEKNKSRARSLKNQTVIYILSESFSDPKRISSNVLSRNPIPEIDSIKEKTTSGLMHSDGYGGGTANMEFQTLTGLPFYNYSRSTSNIYVEVVPQMKFLPSISRAFEGENSYVIHPSGANNYNRVNIYKDLGFKHLIFLVDSDENLQNIEYQGVSVSDKTVYENLLDNLDRNQSQFFSLITMQNHVPWSMDKPTDLTSNNEILDEKQNGHLTSYTRLLHFTDQSTREFLSELEKVEKDITVVFYGDHLPGFYPPSIFKENTALQFQTDYFIWTNFETPKQNYPIVNSSDFSASVFLQTNSKVSPYFALLEEVLKNRKVNTDGQFETVSEFDEDLRLLQFDITSGQGYSLMDTAFFDIP